MRCHDDTCRVCLCWKRERGKRQARSGTLCGCAANGEQSASVLRPADPRGEAAIADLRYCHLRLTAGAERVKGLGCSSHARMMPFR